MASFGTDHVINPFDAFGERLGLALYSPGLYLLREWLTSVPGAPLREPVYPPRGTWVLVGFGRFGKAVRRALVAHGLGTVVIEIDPARAGCDGPCVEGRGTEADTLKLAGIEQAVGLVAGTEQDTNNLSVIMTARDIKPDLFMVARQNHCDNQDLFDAARPSLVMRPSEMIVESILAHLGNPLLARFLELSLGRGESWANELLSRISGVTDDRVPEVWRVHVTAKGAPALHALIREGHSVTVGRLLEAGQARYAILNCVPLMLCREDGEDMLTPGDDILVKSGDRLLLCGRARAADHLYHLLRDHRALRYLVTGDNRPDGWIWRMLGMGRPEPAIGADRER